MVTYKRRTQVRHGRNAQRWRRLRRGGETRISRPALINTLNDDCLAKIFSYLPMGDKLNVQAVCRHWRKNRQLAWRDVRSLDFTSLEQIDFVLKYRGEEWRILKECGRYLHELATKFVAQSSILPIISEYCHNLTKLDIALSVSEQTRTEWFPQMPRLKYLKFQARSQHFSENFFQTLPHENLTELHLMVYLCNYQNQLPPVAVSALKKLKQLSTLTLEGFFLIPDMLTIINQMTSLTHLSLENCTTDEREPLHLDHLTKLEHLNLGMLFRINNRLLTKISETCKGLKFLDLNGCKNISNEGITKLQMLPQLKELILNDITQVTDEPLSKLHSLTKLECSGCYNVGDNGIITLIKYAPRLEYLDLTSSNVSVRVLIEAAEILRHRTNDITLGIDIDSKFRRHWNDKNCPSSLFVLYDYPTISGDDSSDSTSDSDSRNSSDSSDADDSSDTNDSSDCDDTSVTDHFNVSSDTSGTYYSCDSNATDEDEDGSHDDHYDS